MAKRSLTITAALIILVLSVGLLKYMGMKKEDRTEKLFVQALNAKGLSIKSRTQDGRCVVEVNGQDLTVSLDNIRLNYEKDHDPEPISRLVTYRKITRYTRCLNVFLLILILSSVATLYADDAIQVTPCDLMGDPPQYDKKVVTIRAPVKIEFEGSGFDMECQNAEWLSIWVTFAGDVETPVVYCCGNHDRKKGIKVEVEGLQLSLQKDAEFQKYWMLLTANLKTAPTGVPCIWECHQFHVTATLTGHFFAGEKWEREDGKVFYMGYGHMGCCSLFVIEKVSDVEFEPTGIPIGKNWDCSHQTWKLSVERSEIIARQKAVLGYALQEPSVETLGEQIVKDRMKEVGDAFEAGDASTYYEGKFEAEKKARYFWLSKDKLKSYSVKFERFDWLAPYAKEIGDRIWVPLSTERSVCKAK